MAITKSEMDERVQSELATVYSNRFAPDLEYRRRLWQLLVTQFFQKWIPESAAVLDLGCGYGEFINAIRARARFGMDLNPDSGRHLQGEVRFIAQDCSARWPFSDGELGRVFTSNFFEHLPDKKTLSLTLEECFRCLKPGGKLIALGPNIRFTGGRYWDFWDHYLPLTEASLSEGLIVRGFQIECCLPQFLPYTMVKGLRYPLWMVSVYLRVPLLWRVAGKQFLIVARRPG